VDIERGLFNMLKRFVLTVALLITLSFLTTPTYADCDPEDPDCPIDPPQSVEVNPDDITDDASTGEVDSPGALTPLESDLSPDGPEIIDPVPFAPQGRTPPAFESIDVPIRWQEPTDVTCGVQALGMAFDGLSSGTPSSPTIRSFLEENGMMYDFGTGVEELAFAAQNFGYKGSVPFHGWGLDQLREELISGQPVVVSIGVNGEGQPGHFVTVTGVSPDGEWVSYNDPTLGKQIIPTDDFMQMWGAQGYSGVAVRKEVAPRDANLVPWVAAAAGLMGIISQTPLAIRRMGIGGRIVAHGGSSRRRRSIQSQRSRPRFLSGLRRRPAVRTTKPKKLNKGWIRRNRRNPTPPTPEPSPIPIAPTETPTPEPTLTPTPPLQVTPTPTPVPYLQYRHVQPTTGTPYPGVNRTYDRINRAEEINPSAAPAIVSRVIVPTASKAVKYYRKARGIWNTSGLVFNDLADDMFSVSAPRQPVGDKLSFRQKLYIAGTRYSVRNQPAVLSHSIRWKAVKGLGFTALISLATNYVDFEYGENRDIGVKSNEFLASTAVDFAQAGLIGVGAAVGVGAVITGLGLTAPLWAAALATAGAGLFIGWIIDQIIDTDKLKEQVANGFSAFGGIYENTKTIVNIGAQRIGQRITNGLSAYKGIYDNAKTIVDVSAQRVSDTIDALGDNISTGVNEIKDKVGNFIGNIFGKSG
jgi:hypothetical protein